VTADRDVHGVDLDQPDPIEQGPQVARLHLRAGRPATETLGSEGDAACLADGNLGRLTRSARRQPKPKPRPAYLLPVWPGRPGGGVRSVLPLPPSFGSPSRPRVYCDFDLASL
jgi:hypothetical protein